MWTNKLVLGLLALALLAPTVHAQTESLYVDSSTSSEAITSEANCHGASDGAEANISGNLANGQSWTFDFDSTVYTGLPIPIAEIYITHRQSGYIDDSLVLEYFDGTSFIPFESFANVPTVLTTVGPFSADSITSTSQLNGFQVRMRGVTKVGGGAPNSITYYVDAVELRLTYNQAPVVSDIPTTKPR
jgi:hypothetical protein